MGEDGGGDIHSAQFGLSEMVLVICLLRALRVGLELVSIRMTSWRLEGGKVKRTGMDEDILEFFSSLVVFMLSSSLAYSLVPSVLLTAGVYVCMV